MTLAELRKGIAAAAGGVAELVSLGLLSGVAEKWTSGVLAAATAVLVLLVPNADKPFIPPTPPPTTP